LFEPPLPLTIAIVRGPGQCWLTASASARSSRSAALGLIRTPTRVISPRAPVAAGSSTCSLVRKDCLSSRLVVGRAGVSATASA
jgi:hypothetical protein